MKPNKLHIPFICMKLFRLPILLVSLFISINTKGQKPQTFIYDCVTSGQTLVVDAVITNADASTYYRWQYKVLSDAWTCFTNGVNVINGVGFTVSGATSNGANDAPALSIFNATTALENVLVRVTMAKNADPCGSPLPPQVWGGDDQFPEETKYLRLHIFQNSLSCPPNAFQCTNNKLVSSGKYYGGFENSSFDAASESYTRNNIGINYGESDYSFGMGYGHYQDINNPYAMNNVFARNIAPHSGDYQMVVQGSAQLTDRAWHKNIAVISGRQYAFTIWATRVDNTDPMLELRADNTILIVGDIRQQPIGAWNLIQGTFIAPSNVVVDFNIRDGSTGGNNNFSLDDICLRECSNCSILQLHQLNLSASLQQSEVKLKWIAENEMGTNNFVIERSFDGINFTNMASQAVTAAVNVPTTYFYNDNIQSVGLNNTLYYRIKAMDNTGRYAYSNVVIIRLVKTGTVQAWPIPFGDYINFTYNAAVNSKVEIEINNAIGKTIRQGVFNVSRGINQLSIDQVTKLSSGIYFARIKDLNTNAIYILKLSK